MSEQGGDHEGAAGAAESRLARWSRRKSEQQGLQSIDNEEPPSASVGQPDSAVEERLNDEHTDEHVPHLTDADMPPVTSLHAASDYSGFLSPGVSEGLRKVALRKLFALPSFKVRDGLDDYDDDFTVFEPLGDTVTNDPWTQRQKRLAEERERAEREAEQQAAKEAEDAGTEAERGCEDSPENDAADPANAQESEAVQPEAEQDKAGSLRPRTATGSTETDAAVGKQKTSPEEGPRNE